MSNILKNKKIITLCLILLLLPAIVPILEILINCLLFVGRYCGTWIRGIMELGVC